MGDVKLQLAFSVGISSRAALPWTWILFTYLSSKEPND